MVVARQSIKTLSEERVFRGNWTVGREGWIIRVVAPGDRPDGAWRESLRRNARDRISRSRSFFPYVTAIRAIDRACLRLDRSGFGETFGTILPAARAIDGGCI